MTVEDMEARLGAELASGLLFESEGTILSSAEGYNHAACAVIGAMLLNIGKPTFNVYCDNQRRTLGWLMSRTNPICREARQLRSKSRAGDPSVASIFADVRQEFLHPLLSAHRHQGGTPLTAKQEEGVAAMLAAKVLWDARFGNPELAAAVRMLTPRR